MGSGHSRRNFLKTAGLGLAAYAFAGSSRALGKGTADRPNIIIIMTDDMGFSDLGCYGSEIDTPNVDALASNGIRFTQFYNTARCCPTRASLLTGLYAHQAGMGMMTGDGGEDYPAYRGRIMPERTVTIGEVLRSAGYHTITTGKWHVGHEQKEWWPWARGFDDSYSCPSGGGFYNTPIHGRRIVRNNKVIYDSEHPPAEDWYTTDAFTDEGLIYMRNAAKSGKPFLWYLAYNAPHWPLQAKPEDIKKYRGKYKMGWDKLRERRYARMQELGLIDSKWKLSPRDEHVPPWDELSDSEKKKQASRMAVYAAMIDCVDQNVGKVVRMLKELDIFDNTLILFLQDNGACAEGGNLGRAHNDAECGTFESYVKYGTCWANACDTPFQKYKKEIHEGGISTALVAHWPIGIPKEINGEYVHGVSHVIDLMPTCVELAEASYPEKYNGNSIIPMAGKSLVPLLKGVSFDKERPVFWEHMGNRAVRKGRWKLVSEKGEPWSLFDMTDDRTELNDLSAKMPDKAKALEAIYDAWAEKWQVYNKPRGRRRKK